MGTWDENKRIKRTSLLNTAFKLFTVKGLEKTSISEIVNNAGVAKGTFYLYFSDKYDIRNKLIAHKSSQLFQNAVTALGDTEMLFEDKIIFIADHIIDQLDADHSLLGLISKNLSWGIFKNALISEPEEGDVNFRDIYYDMISQDDLHFRDPEIMLFLIVELVSSTCYSAILYQEPVDVNGLKPFLFSTIRAIIRDHLEE